MKLKGDITTLRPITIKDAQSIYLHAKDKEICEAVPLPTPYTLEHAKKYVALTKTFRKDKKEYQFGIEDKTTGQIIGMIGLMHLDFENKKAEVGYWLGKKYWGRGIATDALTVILNYAFDTLRFQRVYAKVNDNNVRSATFLQKNGFSLEGRLRNSCLVKNKWVDELLFGILKEEYKKK